MILLVSLLATAQPVLIPDHPMVDAAVENLEKGDTSALRDVFTAVHSLAMDGQMAVRTPNAAIDLLSGCKATELPRTGNPDFAFYNFEWTCADGDYFAAIAPDDKGRTLSFVDVSALAAYREQRARPIRPPRAPPIVRVAPRGTAEAEAAQQKRDAFRLRRANAVGAALVDGEDEALADRTARDALVAYSFFNPVLSEEFVEMEGDGPEAMAEQLAHLRDTMGKPVSYDCLTPGPITSCTWKFAKPGNVVNALFSVDDDADNADWQINFMRFRYLTTERREQAERNR